MHGNGNVVGRIQDGSCHLPPTCLNINPPASRATLSYKDKGLQSRNLRDYAKRSSKYLLGLDLQEKLQSTKSEAGTNFTPS